MKYIVYYILFFGVSFYGSAQVVDSVQLNQSEVVVFKQIETLDSNLLNRQLYSLSHVLNENTSVQIQEYGAKGSVQSVLIRGLTSNHTKVKWNGLQINSLSLGMFDFGGISSFGNTYLRLNKGANIENDGDGAIGGSIHFGSNRKFDKGSEIKCHFLGGSFDTYALGVVSTISKKNWIYSLAFNKEMANNNFRYKNYKRIGHPILTQSNSEFRSTNLIQEFSFKLKKVKFKSVSWWNGKRKNIPQLLTESQESNKFMADSSFRTVLQAKTYFGKILLSGLVGRDKQWYKYINPEIAYTYYVLTNNQGELKAKGTYKKVKYNFKSNLQIQKAENTNYAGTKNRILNLNTFNVRGKVKKISFKGSIGIQSASDLKKVYPTTVINYSKKHKFLSFKGGLGTHFRQPTFNDLFWKTGGDSELLAETGWNVEQFVSFMNKKFFSVNLGGYYSIVEDWIQWVPLGSVWAPQNVKKIRASGVESTLKTNRTFGKINSVLSSTSSYTSTIVLESDIADDAAVGNQVVNVPFFNTTNNCNFQWKLWRVEYLLSYRGKRYISFDNNEDTALPAYWLSSLGVTKNKKLKNIDWAIYARINNLFNKAYEVIGNTPMPGRSYYLSCKIQFKNKPL